MGVKKKQAEVRTQWRKVAHGMIEIKEDAQSSDVDMWRCGGGVG